MKLLTHPGLDMFAIVFRSSLVVAFHVAGYGHSHKLWEATDIHTRLRTFTQAVRSYGHSHNAQLRTIWQYNKINQFGCRGYIGLLGLVWPGPVGLVWVLWLLSLMWLTEFE